MEPNKTPDGKIEYGAIPIQISILDAMHTGFDNTLYLRQTGPAGSHTLSVQLPSSVTSLGKFHPLESALGWQTDLDTLPSMRRSSQGHCREGVCGVMKSFARFTVLSLAHFVGLITLFGQSIGTPRLSIRQLGAGQSQVSWPSNSTGFVLEAADALSASIAWQPITTAPTIRESEFAVTVPADAATAFSACVRERHAR